MNTPLRLLALISLLAATVPSHAGDGPNWEKYVTPSPTIHPMEFVNFNVDFPGGSVSQLSAALTKIDGVSLSFVAEGENVDLAHVELPAFSLRNVNLITVTEVLRSFLGSNGFEFRPVGGSVNPNTMVLMLKRVEPPKPPKHPSLEFESFRLTPFLEAQNVEEIVGAIRAGWELDPAHDPKALSLKFHPGTSILLVSGPGDALRVTESVVRNLKHNPEVPPKAEQISPSAPAAEKK